MRYFVSCPYRVDLVRIELRLTFLDGLARESGRHTPVDLTYDACKQGMILNR